MNTKPHTTYDSATLSNQLLRINDVVALTTLSKSCVNLWVAQGRFPKPIVLSSTLKVWRLSDLSDWIDRQFTMANDAGCNEQSVRTTATTRTDGRL